MAVQDNQCTPDTSSSTAACQEAELDLTTYLSIQQGQCCLQCPGQQQCTADASKASQNTSQTAEEAYKCGSFVVSIAVGSSLDGSSLEDLLDTAVNGGLLELYLQTSGLPDASVLSVGPTGTCLTCLVFGVLSALFNFVWALDSSSAELLPQVLAIYIGLLTLSRACSTKMSSIQPGHCEACFFLTCKHRPFARAKHMCMTVCIGIAPLPCRCIH